MQEIVTFSGSPPARVGQVYARSGNPIMFIISAQARVVIPDLIRNPAQIPAFRGDDNYNRDDPRLRGGRLSEKKEVKGYDGVY